jgi:hypothetical protein
MPHEKMKNDLQIKNLKYGISENIDEKKFTYTKKYLEDKQIFLVGWYKNSLIIVLT